MESTEQKLIRIAADHAYWAERVSIHKRKGSDHLMECIIRTYEINTLDKPKNPKHCIEKVREEVIDLNFNSSWHDGYEFDEIWHEMVESGEVCKDCQSCREHRKQRIYASRRLGQVRSAITRIGKSLTPSVEVKDEVV